MLDRILALVVEVKPGERRALLWSFAYFFLILSAYYVLRPLRDQMAIAGGTRALPWLFTATFATLLLAQPVYGASSASLRLLYDLRADLRYAFRTLRRSRGFSIVAVLSFALGIGANIAIFSLVSAVMLRSLPVREPHRLVQITRELDGLRSRLAAENEAAGSELTALREERDLIRSRVAEMLEQLEAI